MVKASSLSFPASTALGEILVFISKLKSLNFSVLLFYHNCNYVSIIYKYLHFLILKKYKLKSCVWKHLYFKTLNVLKHV